MAFKVNVTFTEGLLCKFTQADVLVNSTNQELLLHEGDTSNSMLKEAGRPMQQEARRLYPEPICYGEVAITGGFKLKCKKVFHVAMPFWTMKVVNPQEILCRIVCNCLQEAHKANMTSIAFPTLGCGFLKFPLDMVTETMCQCIAKFEANTKQSSLTHVYIVIYNKGSDWKIIKQAFIEAHEKGQQGQRMISSCVRDFLTPCQRESMVNSCGKTLPCSHVCMGYKDESTCPPCLKSDCRKMNAALTQDFDDDCTICFTERLGAGPIVMLKCGHAFHLHCAKQILETKWHGPRLIFTFMLCPLCKIPMEHPALDKVLQPIKHIHDDVKRKALTRLNHEGLDKGDAITKMDSPFYGKPELFAMDRYCYYPCFKCKQAYFGGAAQCEAGVAEKEYKPEELVCPSCSGPQNVQNCPTHGTDYIEYKCRYCCSVAVFFCHGTTHYCDPCHSQYSKVSSMKVYPQCPVGPGCNQLAGKCPLGIGHPPTGQEHCLGCGLCLNMASF